MRHFARTSLGMLALGLIAPITASAQYGDSTASGGYLPAPMPTSQPAAPAATPTAAPAGYQSASAVQTSSPAPQPVAAPAPAPHVHKGRTICAACAAKQGLTMPPGKFVACEHSKNGVCTKCQAYLDGPGTFVTAGATAREAPGRAMASSGAGGYDGSMGDPAPVGVVQAGYSQSSGAMPMSASMAAGMQANAPGRAIAESAPSPTPGRDFYHTKSNNGFPHPHILGHLFGWSGIGSERREERDLKKSQAHAMLTYDPNAPTGVDELPAKTVFGKQK